MMMIAGSTFEMHVSSETLSSAQCSLTNLREWCVRGTILQNRGPEILSGQFLNLRH